MDKDDSKPFVFALDNPRMLKLLEKMVRESLDRDELIRHHFSSETPATSQSGVPKSDLIAAAKKMYLCRRHRLQMFPESMFGEPAWDILLSIYSLSDTVAALSVGRLCALSGAPPTTALRWIDYLTSHGLLSRMNAVNDKRKAMISITPKAEEALDRYFAEILSDASDGSKLLGLL